MKMYENLDLKDLDGEIWKDILDYEGDYQVSNIGRVKSFKRYHGTNIRILKQYNIGEYLYIVLSKNKKSKTRLIHRLVYEAHIGNLEDGYDAHHINEDTKDNFVKNLESREHREHTGYHSKINKIGNKNCVGKYHSETTKRKMSESNPRKLSDQKYIDIRIDIEKGDLTHREIAKKHGVGCTIISYIKTGKRGKYSERNKR